MHHVDPLTWTSAFTSWQFAYGWNALILLAGVGYWLGLRRLRRDGPRGTNVGSGRNGRTSASRWPRHRTVLYGTGLVCWALAMNSSIGIYSHVLFTMHMVQHLMLIMVVPALLVYGKPLQLLAEADRSGHWERRLRGRVVGWLTHPLGTSALYTLVLVATHLTPFMQVMLLNPGLHHFESALYLVTGYLTFLPLIGSEPTKWQTFPYPLRVFVAFMAMLPDTGIGVVLMTADQPLFPAYHELRDWGMSVLADQRAGGAVMWFFGDAIMALFAIIMVAQWMRAQGSQAGFGTWLESARQSALATTDETAASESTALSESSDVDEDERARLAYNAMLARLAGRSPGDTSQHEEGREQGPSTSNGR